MEETKYEATKYDDWPVWKLWLAWAWSVVRPGNDEWQTLNSVIERKTAFNRRMRK